MPDAGSWIRIKPFVILGGREKRLEIQQPTKHRRTDDTTCALMCSQARDGAVLRPGSGIVLNGIHDSSWDVGKDLLTNITWRPHGRCSTNDLCHCHIPSSQIIAAENPRPLQHSRWPCLCLTQTHEPLLHIFFFSPHHIDRHRGFLLRYCTPTGPQMTSIRR